MECMITPQKIIPETMMAWTKSCRLQPAIGWLLSLSWTLTWFMDMVYEAEHKITGKTGFIPSNFVVREQDDDGTLTPADTAPPTYTALQTNLATPKTSYSQQPQ
jgi:hypothetical protein